MMENRAIFQAESGEHTIFHGDAVHILATLPNESVDLIFADPPYNIGKKYANFIDNWPSDEAYVAWCEKWLLQCLTLLKPHGSLYLMASTQSMPFLDVFLRTKLEILSRIVWHYDSSGVQAQKHFGSMYEPILHCVKDTNNYTFNACNIMVEAKTGAKRQLIDYRKTIPTLYNREKVPGNVWNFPRVRYRMPEYEQHPTQKPETLLARIIAASSNEGDLVLDPFAGTFTTCAVAQKLKRRSIGIELEEDYVKIGLRRLNILSTYKGEKLQPPEKTYSRRNGKTKTSPNQLTLLESSE